MADILRLMKFFCLSALLACFAVPSAAQRLVILHTNDTHSQIDPYEKSGLGGVARRMVLIDSVRAAEQNVLLIDAGDVVQGTLFFVLYGGEVEQKLMNEMRYDIRVLGNHEFDNGVDSLAAVLRLADSQFLATNYDLSNSPLAGKFQKYTIREYDGKRIGFFAVNLAPEGMIAEGNYDNVLYLDAIQAANASAAWLKHVERCDKVVAITHIGYNPEMPPGDVALAQASRDIDIIIGGHSHDRINSVEKSHILNADGKPVLVAQAGSRGEYLGEITLDFASDTPQYRLIPVDSRLDDRLPERITDIIQPYRQGVDSLMQVPVIKSRIELPQSSAALLNLATDIVLNVGATMADNIDFAILNKGGLRRGLPKGTVTEGQVIDMMPFTNRIVVIDIKGSDLLEAFNVMARVGGNGVSEGVDITFTGSEKDAYVTKVTIHGSLLDPDRIYRVATIDYLANGGDYMQSLKNHTLIAQSPVIVYKDVLAHLRALASARKFLNPSSSPRMHK